MICTNCGKEDAQTEYIDWYLCDACEFEYGSICEKINADMTEKDWKEFQDKLEGSNDN